MICEQFIRFKQKTISIPICILECFAFTETNVLKPFFKNGNYFKNNRKKPKSTHFFNFFVLVNFVLHFSLEKVLLCQSRKWSFITDERFKEDFEIFNPKLCDVLSVFPYYHHLCSDLMLRTEVTLFNIWRLSW